MRTCMYCGKELAEGEKCDCYASRARRGENFESEKKEPDENINSEPKKEKKEKKTRYQTGYAGGDNRFERARDRYRAKKAARKNREGGGYWSDLWHYVLTAVKNPVDAVTNPRTLGKGAILLIAALAGALMWLCMFFIMRGGAVGPFKLISSAMGFGEGWGLITKILAAAASGAVSGIVIFFIYSGIFYLINRFVMRMKTPYWHFCERLMSAWIPFTEICLIGTVLSILSPLTLTALVACGAAGLAALTYEGLKTEWITASPSKVLAAMTLGYFVFFVIMAHIIL